MASDKQTIRMLRKKLESKDKKIKSLQNAVDKEEGLWNVYSGMDRSAIDTVLLHSQELIARILEDPARLQSATGLNPDQFEYVLERFVKDSGNMDTRLFAEDGLPDPGNRCLLDRRTALLLTLMRKKTGTTQDILGLIFDIDQSTVSRYLNIADHILSEILPTADRIAKLIRKARTQEEFEELVPDNTIIVNDTEVPRQRPVDKEERKKTYSGKKKNFTFNTTVTTNKAVADLMIPEKKPKGRNLTDRQKKRNKKISSKRITVEHSIGSIKQWGIMSEPYDGTIEDFHCEFVVTTGLANLRMLWNTRKKKPRLDY